MDERLQRETVNLVKSWTQHDPAMLRDYLVSDVEDPRLNVQSILTRHFLVEALFGERFNQLREAELRFAIALNWLLQFLKTDPDDEQRDALLHAFNTGADNVEGMKIPRFLLALHGSLPTSATDCRVPDYLQLALSEAHSRSLPESAKQVFQQLWRDRLAKETAGKISVLEPACGSANDYRFLDRFGLARFIDYTGFDLCDKNVANARALFPEMKFEIGNVFEIPAPDKAFDYCFVHDLLEHLSIEGMQTAVAEMARVTRKAVAVHFFQMEETEDHVLRPVENFYVNLLSMARTRELFTDRGGDVQVIHIGSFLRWCFNCPETYNDNAYTFVVKF